MSQIKLNQQELIKEFSALHKWEDRYRLIIEKGKQLPSYPEKFRLDEFKVKGCQSQVWLYPELKENKLYFYADSDASIVKGIISIILSIYSAQPLKEIIEVKPIFIEEIGLSQHLSMSRANGLNSMLKQIMMYAVAFMHKET